MVNATPTTGETPTDPFCLFLDILHHAVSQDGTLDTAQESLHTIQDLALAGIRRACPHIAVTLRDDAWHCRRCDVPVLLESSELIAADSR